MDYPHPRLERYATSLDAHETSRDWVVNGRFGRRDRGLADTAACSATLAALRPKLTKADLSSPEAFRHSGWRRTRRRVSEALRSAGVPYARANRFDSCGQKVWLCGYKDDPERYVLVGNYCRDRFCQPCNAARSRFIAAAVAERVQVSTHRFITLTLQSRDEPLRLLLQKLQRSWSKLKQCGFWRRAVLGGISFLEVKRNLVRRRWNVHLHAIVHGTFLPQKLLASEWKRITEGSYVVDIRLVRDPHAVSRYVAKYATKGINPSQLGDNDELVEAIRAMRGVRTITTFGDWRRIQLRPAPTTDELIPIAPLRWVLEAASAEQAAAVAILAKLTHTRYTDYPGTQFR